jgi:hypothetical protein
MITTGPHRAAAVHFNFFFFFATFAINTLSHFMIIIALLNTFNMHLPNQSSRALRKPMEFVFFPSLTKQSLPVPAGSLAKSADFTNRPLAK